MYKTLKVYDITNMPQHIRNIIKDRFEIMCNGCYFEYEVQPKTYLEIMSNDAEVYVENEAYSELDEWFTYSAGAEPNELVIILYWW